MEAYILRIELTESQVKAVQNEVDIQNAWERENGYNGTWTMEKQLAWSVREYIHSLEKEATQKALTTVLHSVNPVGEEKENYENRTRPDRKPAAASGGI